MKKPLQRALLIVLGIFALLTFAAAPAAPTAAANAALPTPLGGWQAGWGVPGATGFNQDGSLPMVNAIAASGTNVYVGGHFGIAGGHNANSIARWNNATSTWEVLGANSIKQGNGTNGIVHAIAILPNGNVIVGGEFTRVYNSTTSSLAVNNIAGWDPTTEQWFVLGGSGATRNGVNGPVYALAVVNNTYLYVGGDFTQALNFGGPLTVNNIAGWEFATFIGSNGQFSRLGNATGNGTNAAVRALHWKTAGLDGGLYVGGDFTQTYSDTVSFGASRIVRWNVPALGPAQWQLLNVGMNGPVNAITDLNGVVYAGGDFTSAGSSNAQNIAYWDGGDWKKLGIATNAGVDDIVNGLTSDGTSVYATGEFARVYRHDTGATQFVNYIARWDGSAWNSTNGNYGVRITGLDVSGDFVNALAVGNGYVWAGGAFTGAWQGPSESIMAVNVARWEINTSEWSALAPSNVSTLGADNQVSFNQIGVNDLLTEENNLYATGAFSGIGGVRSSSISRFDIVSSTWNLMGAGDAQSGTQGNGLFGEGRVLALNGTQVLAAGLFTEVCDGPSGISCISAESIANWQQPSGGWSAVSAGDFPGGIPTTLAVTASNQFFVGGFFSSAPGLPANGANRVAFFNGTVYSALGSGTSATGNGLNGAPQALVWDAANNRLFVGGSFTTAYNSNVSSATVNGVALWDVSTSSWSAVGGGVSGGTVTAMVLDGDYLYVGGNFTQAGTGGGAVAVRGIARYHLQDSVWEALGTNQPGVLGNFPSFDSNITGSVYDMVVHEGYLYLAGDFIALTNGSTKLAAHRLARYNLSTGQWQGYADGPQTNIGNGDVWSVAIDAPRDTLYLGGYFDKAGGVPAHRLAALNTNTAPAPGLLVEITGTLVSGGSVASNLPGIDCASQRPGLCSAPFASGTSLTLTATPDTGFAFTGWGGACAAAGSTPTCNLTATANTYVTATFTQLRTLTINKIGAGSGTVTSSPAGIDCGATCTFQFIEGTQITLTATPGSGSRFFSWSGSPSPCSTSTTCQFTLNSNTTITAEFLPNTLSVNLAGGGSGTVVSSPAGINCTWNGSSQSGTCSANFDLNTVVTLSAAPSLSVLGIWGIDCNGASGATCTLTMDSPKQAYLSFFPATDFVFLPLIRR